ncbi:histidine phosphotransferase HPT1p [Emericellopsis cladophorae]|uniref:Histidine phosphotransferase HPT1p n=1 Tax=Emericellopsis cladophorae TaxID=2686198 RepID=A0A9P9Y1P6_9HYPO|nr:histidine phosphotransferase HPT1p [Emericellopsis cladophorae]KAI6781538.1 histidine phosphotransferase HPT1p [Emericellopsis cladophorae]
MAPAQEKVKSDDELPELESVVDMTTFNQILEMDDPDDHSFSSSIVFDFFDQADQTFTEMDDALDAKDLFELSAKGHFLKGSSATLGLVKVRDGCEKIQRYGKKENVDGTPEPDEALCLSRIEDVIKVVKDDISDARRVLTNYYDKKEKEDA